MDWSKEKTIKLINTIRARPVIWDANSDDYKNKDLKQKKLNEIAEMFNCKRGDIENKLKNLKVQYCQEMQEIMKARAAGDVYESKWFAFKLMKSLRCKKKKRNNTKVGYYS